MFKYIYILFLIPLFVTCSDSENIEKVGVPSDFEVKVESSTYNNVLISWSESFDPENGKITYSIYLDDTLIESNLEIREYRRQDLKPLTNYTGRIVAKDIDGNEKESFFDFITEGNLPPSQFAIELINTSNVSAFVVWSESIDPEDQEVKYDIYLDEVLQEENSNFLNYNFEGLKAATTYNAKIIAYDPDNNTTTLEFQITTNDGIYSGDVSLSSQSSVKSFGDEGYVEITGNFKIEDVTQVDRIIDLSPLLSLKIVRGYMDIRFTHELISLEGLKIETIGKSLRIEDNFKLLNLKGFENLNEVFGSLEIKQNRELKEINNLNNLSLVGNILRIYNNLRLEEINGFNSLISVQYLLIKANYELHTIVGFNNLGEVDNDFFIYDNELISLIEGFSALTNIGSRLYLRNTLVRNIDMFKKLSKVGGDIEIIANNQLENIQGLSDLIEITYGDLAIGGNPKLTSLNGLEEFNVIGDDIIIGNNASLTDFCALRNIVENFSQFGTLTTVNNPFNPTVADIINGNCKL